MDPRTFMLISYVILGGIFVIFNSFIGSFFYKLTLLLTDKIKVSEFFVFKIDSRNRNSFFFLTKSFSAFFGIAIIASALYYL